MDQAAGARLRNSARQAMMRIDVVFLSAILVEAVVLALVAAAR